MLTEYFVTGVVVEDKRKYVFRVKWKLFCNSGSTQLCQSVKASFASLTSKMSLIQEGRREQTVGNKENCVNIKQ